MPPGARRRRAAKRRRKGKNRAARRSATIQIQINGITVGDPDRWLQSLDAELFRRAPYRADLIVETPPRHAMSGGFEFTFQCNVVDEYDDPIWFTTRPLRSVFDELFRGIDRSVAPERLGGLALDGSSDIADSTAYAMMAAVLAGKT